MSNLTYIKVFIYIYLVTLSTFDLGAQSDIVNKSAVKNIRIINEKDINSTNLETSPAFVGDKIGYVFTSPKFKLFDKEINEAYFELSLASVRPDNTLHSPTPLNKKYNSELHEGPMAYDIHQNKLYFTRSIKDKKANKNKDNDTTYLRIMAADFNVVNPVVQPINISIGNYSVCHPTLSYDGKSMIFASNMPGGFGGYDLYKAYYNDEEWTGIINLGPQINTTANEVFPFLINDALLVYTSSRSGGLGGLDIYVTTLHDGSWSISELLPKPINSAYDDLGMIVRENMRSGYFASNRPGGLGKDDIYRFETEKPLFGKEEKTPYIVTAHILDKLTLESVPDVKFSVTPLELDINDFALSSYNVDMLSGRKPGDIVLKLTPKKGTQTQNIFSNQNGIIRFTTFKGQKYHITTSAAGYEDLSLLFDHDLIGSDFNIVIEPKSNDTIESYIDTLVTESVPMNIPVEPGKSIIFDQILYDYNSYTIKPGAVLELDALAKVMISKPDIKIRLEAHTDSRGSNAYNLQLSINRAEAARNYLINLGVEAYRIKIKGWGESKLRNKCTDKVPCKEEDHAYNRRTEVIIEE